MHIHYFFEEKARSGDATFAVAYALLRLAEALDRLGLNYGYDEGSRPPGAVEKLAMEAGRLAGAAERIAGALEERAE